MDFGVDGYKFQRYIHIIIIIIIMDFSVEWLCDTSSVNSNCWIWNHSLMDTRKTLKVD
jgi:hypothetical protein